MHLILNTNDSIFRPHTYKDNNQVNVSSRAGLYWRLGDVIIVNGLFGCQAVNIRDKDFIVRWQADLENTKRPFHKHSQDQSKSTALGGAWNDAERCMWGLFYIFKSPNHFSVYRARKDKKKTLYVHETWNCNILESQIWKIFLKRLTIPESQIKYFLLKTFWENKNTIFSSNRNHIY